MFLNFSTVSSLFLWGHSKSYKYIKFLASETGLAKIVENGRNVWFFFEKWNLFFLQNRGLFRFVKPLVEDNLLLNNFVYQILLFIIAMQTCSVKFAINCVFVKFIVTFNRGYQTYCRYFFHQASIQQFLLVTSNSFLKYCVFSLQLILRRPNLPNIT